MNFLDKKKISKREFKKLLEVILENRPPYIHSPEQIKKFSDPTYWLVVLAIPYLILNIGWTLTVANEEVSDQISAWYSILFTGTCFIPLLYMLFVKRWNFLPKNTNINDWRWKMGRYYFFTISLLILVISIYTLGVFQHDLAITSLLCFLTGVIATNNILKNPEILFNRTYLRITESLLLLGAISLVVGLFNPYKYSEHGFSATVLNLGLVFTLFNALMLNRVKTDRIIIEEIIPSFIHPRIIANKAKSVEQLTKEKLRALKLLGKITKDDQSNVELLVLDELLKRNKDQSRFSKFRGVLIALVIYIIGALSEGLLQDAFNDAHIKPFLCRWLQLFC